MFNLNIYVMDNYKQQKVKVASDIDRIENLNMKLMEKVKKGIVLNDFWNLIEIDSENNQLIQKPFSENDYPEFERAAVQLVTGHNMYYWSFIPEGRMLSLTDVSTIYLTVLQIEI